MDVTFLELHLHDAEFNAPFAAGRSRGAAEESSTDDPAAEADRTEAAGKAGPVAALLAVVGLAMLARYLRGGEAEQSTLDEVEA
ncbi:MAG: hypothetical protein U5J98_08810 [Halobacteriales archaeon]|nr:hypothetical protein [Halobacteriales archaeon]